MQFPQKDLWEDATQIPRDIHPGRPACTCVIPNSRGRAGRESKWAETSGARAVARKNVRRAMGKITMLPYGRNVELQNRARDGEEGKARERREKGGEKSDTQRSRACDGARWRREQDRLYVVCAWRGWRLPHEALRAELSYSHTYVYTEVRARRAGPDLITLPYT